MEENGEEKAWEKARPSQEEWNEQIKKWKEKYNRVTDTRIKDSYKIWREEKIEETEDNEETSSIPNRRRKTG